MLRLVCLLILSTFLEDDVDASVSTPPAQSAWLYPTENAFPGHALRFGEDDVPSVYLITEAPTKQPFPDPVPNEVTVEAWVRISKHKTHNWIAGTRSRSGGWAMFTDGGEKACFGLFQKGSLKTISSRTLQTPYAWHHVAGVFDGRQIKVYVDASPGDSVPLADARLDDPLGYTIGGSPEWAPLYMVGQIDSVRIWSQGHTRVQVAQDMLRAWEAAGRSGLVAAWELDEGVGQEAGDGGPHGWALRFSEGAALPRWQTSTAPAFLVDPHPAAAARNHTLLLPGPLQEAEGTAVVVSKGPSMGAVVGGGPGGRAVGPLAPGQAVQGALLYVPPEEPPEDPPAPLCTHLELRRTSPSPPDPSFHKVEVMVGGGVADALALWQACRVQRHAAATTRPADHTHRALPLVSVVVALEPLLGAPSLDHCWAAIQTVFDLESSADLYWDLLAAYPHTSEGRAVAGELRARAERAGLGPRLKLLPVPPAAGRAGGLNAAAAAARAPWVLMLEPGWGLHPGLLLHLAGPNASTPTPAPARRLMPAELTQGFPQYLALQAHASGCPEPAPRAEQVPSGFTGPSPFEPSKCEGGLPHPSSADTAPEVGMARAVAETVASAMLGSAELAHLFLPNQVLPRAAWQLPVEFGVRELGTGLPLGLLRWDLLARTMLAAKSRGKIGGAWGGGARETVVGLGAGASLGDMEWDSMPSGSSLEGGGVMWVGTGSSTVDAIIGRRDDTGLRSMIDLLRELNPDWQLHAAG